MCLARWVSADCYIYPLGTPTNALRAMSSGHFAGKGPLFRHGSGLFRQQFVFRRFHPVNLVSLRLVKDEQQEELVRRVFCIREGTVAYFPGFSAPVTVPRGKIALVKHG